jgi:glycosyltransferase involved in cell wall biosynthesis
MRILLVTHNVVRGDGQGRINYELAHHALRCGHSLTIVAHRADHDLVAAGARLIPIRPRLTKPNLLKVVQFARKANRIVRQARADCDVVIGNGYVFTEPHDLNLCQFVHGAWIHSPVHVSRVSTGPYAWYQYLYTSCNSKWEKLAYAAARFVVAPSQQIRGELIGIGVPDEKVRVIYNGVDLEEFHPGPEDRAGLQLVPTGPLALFVGDIRTPRKNLDSVLRAMVSSPLLHLAVVGAVERSPFPQMARELGIADRVHFLGFRRDVSQLMRACDMFTFPSRYEAGSLVLLEAMGSALPIVTARSAGGSELISRDAGVVLDSPEDVAGLARAMNHFAADPQARIRAGQAARRIAEDHSWTRMAQEYLMLAQERIDAVARSQP